MPSLALPLFNIPFKIALATAVIITFDTDTINISSGEICGMENEEKSPTALEGACAELEERFDMLSSIVIKNDETPYSSGAAIVAAKKMNSA